MEGSDIRAAKRLFEEALDLPPLAREGHVAERCGGNEVLRRQVLALLRAREDARDFLLPPTVSCPLATPSPAGTASAHQFPAPGAVLDGRYRLDAVIGEGGWGRVHRATDLLLDESVAVKLLGLDSPADVRRARREVAALRLLRLPGVVRMLDEGTAEDCAYIVMDLVEGHPFPGAHGPLPWDAIAPAATSLLEATDACHRAGFVHGDLKPANVLVTAGGRSVILDLGLAAGESPRHRAASAGEDGGTPRYLAPERFRGEPATPRSDLYSAGAMLYEALAGCPPHDVRGVAALAAERLSTEPRPVAELAPGCPPAVADAVMHLLRRDPERRPVSANSVLRSIGAATSDGARLRSLPALQSDGPLDETAMRRLFSGPDRLTHVVTDSIRLLAARTGGSPRDVARELESWLRRGDARWEGDRLAVMRESLDRQMALTSVASPAELQRQAPRDLSAGLRRLLAIIALCAGRADVALLARVEDASVGQVAERLGVLLHRNLVQAQADGRLIAVARIDAASTLTQATARLVHEHVARSLEAGSPGRLAHVIASGDRDLLADEALAAARRFEREGQATLAVGALLDGLPALEAPSTDARAELYLGSLVVSAISTGSATVLRRVLHELELLAQDAGPLARLRQLARAALIVTEGDWRRGESLADELGVMDTTELELCRHSVRLTAERRGTRAREAEILEELRPWVEGCGDRGAAAAHASWTGWLLYSQGRHAEAAAQFDRVAELVPGSARAAAARVARASSLLEAGRHEEAAECAQQAARDATSLRHATLLARAEWVHRCALYRMGRASAIDFELAEAAAEIGVPDTEASICLNEAAVAWRLGLPDEGRRLAQHAERAWRRIGRAEPAALARALALACGAPCDDAEVERLIGALPPGAPPGVVAQCCALAACAHPAAKGSLLERARSAAARLPRETWSWRREVASIVECLGMPEGSTWNGKTA